VSASDPRNLFSTLTSLLNPPPSPSSLLPLCKKRLTTSAPH
jgi:hypothetical protein